jgi:hypothetical protein
MKSTDRGDTWSNVRRVNDDPLRNGKDQFFTWMSVDPKTGEIAIIYYDRRRYDGDSTDVYLARSTDGGETFLNSRISDAAFYPTASVFFGDYSCIASFDGRIRPIWTELSGGLLSIHTALIDPAGTLVHSLPSGGGISLSQNYPNPFTRGRTGGAATWTTIPFEIGEGGSVRLAIHDLLGRQILVLIDRHLERGPGTAILRGDQLPPGTYLVRLEAGGAVRCRFLTCLR